MIRSTQMQINEACEKALSVEAYGYRSILTLLELKAEARTEQGADKDVLPKHTKTYKFTRPIEEYQELLTQGGKDEYRDSQQTA